MAPRIRPLSEIKSKLLRPATTSHFECDFVIPGASDRGVLKFLNQRIGEVDKDLINLSCFDGLTRLLTYTVPCKTILHGITVFWSFWGSKRCFVLFFFLAAT